MARTMGKGARTRALGSRGRSTGRGIAVRCFLSVGILYKRMRPFRELQRDTCEVRRARSATDPDRRALRLATCFFGRPLPIHRA